MTFYNTQLGPIISLYRGAEYQGRRGEYEAMLKTEAEAEEKLFSYVTPDNLAQNVMLMLGPSAGGRYLLELYNLVLSISHYESVYREQQAEKERAERKEQARQEEAQRVLAQQEALQAERARQQAAMQAEYERRVLADDDVEYDDKGYARQLDPRYIPPPSYYGSPSYAPSQVGFYGERPLTPKPPMTREQKMAAAISDYVGSLGYDPEDIAGVNAKWNKETVNLELEFFFFGPNGTARSVRG